MRGSGMRRLKVMGMLTIYVALQRGHGKVAVLQGIYVPILTAVAETRASFKFSSLELNTRFGTKRDIWSATLINRSVYSTPSKESRLAMSQSTTSLVP